MGSRLVDGARPRGGRARSLSLCRLWVPRNFRTLPESFQSVKCLGEVGCVWGCQEWGGAALGLEAQWVVPVSGGRRPLTAIPATR